MITANTYIYTLSLHDALPILGAGWVLQSETHYLYDGNRVIQERDSSNRPTVVYTRGNDLSGSLEGAGGIGGLLARTDGDRKSTRLNSSHQIISYAVFCLKKKT